MDYGGENLDDLLERYKRKYEQALICAGDPPLFGPNAFPLQAVYEFVGLYETRYPERKGALANFFREVDAEFLEHMIKIKCMVYMLEEKAARKMAGFMKRKRGIFIKMFFEKNTAKGGAQAFFTHTFLGKPKIMYYEIASKSELKPPYKTFFHEFGHAIDNLSKRGFGYYSDTFKHSQKAGKKKLIYDSRLGAYSIGTTTGIYKKTIHEWACLDLENMLIQVAYDLMKKNITSMPDKRRYLSPASPPPDTISGSLLCNLWTYLVLGRGKESKWFVGPAFWQRGKRAIRRYLHRTERPLLSGCFGHPGIAKRPVWRNHE